jgi:hypothetical protein
MIEDFLFRQHLETVPETPDLADPEAVHREWAPTTFTDQFVRYARRETIEAARRDALRFSEPYGPTGYRTERNLEAGRITIVPIGPGEMAFDMVIDPACPPDRVYMVPKDWDLGGRSWL